MHATVCLPAQIMPPSSPASSLDVHVPETRFGRWFLRTQTWLQFVLDPAIDDLDRMISDRKATYGTVIDVGVGWGYSLKRLSDRFAPTRLIGMDVDPDMVAAARQYTLENGVNAEFICCSASHINLPDASVDIVFCHQTFHHLVHQEAALAEFMRILKPGGMLLFAESTRRYIHSWIIRLLFRHPMDVQKTAAEYLQLVRDAGFQVGEERVSYPYLWWSRPDLGALQRWFGIQPPANREETLINLVALKPL